MHLKCFGRILIPEYEGRTNRLIFTLIARQYPNQDDIVDSIDGPVRRLLLPVMVRTVWLVSSSYLIERKGHTFGMSPRIGKSMNGSREQGRLAMIAYLYNALLCTVYTLVSIDLIEMSFRPNPD